MGARACMCVCVCVCVCVCQWGPELLHESTQCNQSVPRKTPLAPTPGWFAASRPTARQCRQHVPQSITFLATVNTPRPLAGKPPLTLTA